MELFKNVSPSPDVSGLGSAVVQLAVLHAGLDDFPDLVERQVAAVQEDDGPVPVRPAENSRAAPLVLAEFLESKINVRSNALF